jgi:hypothetical protein
MSWWQSEIVLGFGLLLLLGGGGWWLYARRVASRVRVLPAARYLDALRDEFPEAFDVLSRFEQNLGLESLTEGSPDLEKAVDEIRNYALLESRAQKQTSSLKISPEAVPGDSRKLKAALVRIVRGIYADPKNVDGLGEGGQDALDAFLGSLVE